MTSSLSSSPRTKSWLCKDYPLDVLGTIVCLMISLKMISVYYFPSVMVTVTLAVIDFGQRLFFITIPHLVHSVIISFSDLTFELHFVHGSYSSLYTFFLQSSKSSSTTSSISLMSSIYKISDSDVINK